MGDPVRPLGSNSPLGPKPVPVRTGPRTMPLVPEHELPLADRRGTSALDQSVERVADLAGMVVEQVLVLPRRFAELKQRLIFIRTHRRQQVSLAAAQYRNRAERKLDEARNRAEILANEYPVQVILGAAALGFAVGLGLRIWRSNHAAD